MLHPSYTDLMRIVNEGSDGDTPVVNSRYSIVMATAKRAREIISDPHADPDDRAKPLSAAVRELNEGILHILPDDSPDEDEITAEEGSLTSVEESYFQEDDDEEREEDGEDTEDDPDLYDEGDESSEDEN